MSPRNPKFDNEIIRKVNQMGDSNCFKSKTTEKREIEYERKDMPPFVFIFLIFCFGLVAGFFSAIFVYLMFA